MMMGDVQSKGLQPKKTPVTDDYILSSKVLGLGINGKVVVCHTKSDNRKCALKVTCLCCHNVGLLGSTLWSVINQLTLFLNGSYKTKR